MPKTCRRHLASNMPVFNRPISARTLSSKLRARLAAEDGLTIVEVAVTGLMVGLIALSLIGLDAAGKTAADQRRRAQAFAVAQADQERIKGLSADQIANLNQTRTVTLDGVVYTVTSTGQFLSSAADSASCSTGAAAADYAKIISTVDWPSNAARRRRRAERRHPARRRRAAGQGPSTRTRTALPRRAGRRRRLRPEHRRGAPLRDHRRRAAA